MTDFVVRGVPLGFMLALAQGSHRNTTVSPALLVLFPLSSLFFFVQEYAAILYAFDSMKDVTSSDSGYSVALLYAWPSTLSCTPMFFGCFGARGVPNVFDFRRFFKVHWFRVAESVAIMCICVSIRAKVVTRFASFFYPFVVSVVFNLITGFTMQFACHWK